MGSFVPYLYYAFYCTLWAKLFYLALIGVLGCGAIIVSMSNEFAKAQYRPLRAALFIALGLSGVIPCVHAVIVNGFWVSINHGSLGWLVLMAVLYISGASIYAARVPERCCPGKFDIWVSNLGLFTYDFLFPGIYLLVQGTLLKFCLTDSSLCGVLFVKIHRLFLNLIHAYTKVTLCCFGDL